MCRYSNQPFILDIFIGYTRILGTFIDIFVLMFDCKKRLSLSLKNENMRNFWPSLPSNKVLHSETRVSALWSFSSQIYTKIEVIYYNDHLSLFNIHDVRLLSVYLYLV